MKKWYSILMWVTIGSSLTVTLPAFATNWVMLQGTESSPSDGTPRLWGFVQAEYQFADGSDIAAGPWQGQPMASNLIGPDLESSSTFNLKRARLGARGTISGSDNFNYLIGIEGGKNAATRYGDGVVLKVRAATIASGKVSASHFAKISTG